MIRELPDIKQREKSYRQGRKAALCFIFSFFIATQIFAQTRTISGLITSLEDGAPLPGASVVVKGTTNGTITSIEGTYSISASSNDVLVFSFVGYESTEVPVGDKSTIDVVLASDLVSLSEVVVVGYGTVKKTDLTGSVSLVDAKELTKVNTNDVTQMLQGRVPGVAINSDGQPGASPKVRIRGISTFGTGGTDAEPLYVVDGLPLNGTINTTGDRANPSGQISAIRDINPNDIESIQVLKDASAGAIYGVRAANGVVIITTKKGKLNQPLKVDISSYVGIQKVSNLIPVLKREQYQQINREVFINGGVPEQMPNGNNPDHPNYVTDIDTDWQKEGIKDGAIQNVNVGFTGGGSNTTYFASFDYFNNTGTMVGNAPNYKRYSVRLNTDSRKGKFRFGQNMYVSRSDENPGLRVSGTPGANPPFINDLIWATPTIPVIDESRLGGYGGSSGSIENALSLNIIGLNSMVVTNRRISRGLVGAYAEYDIFEGLTYRLNGSYDYTVQNDDLFVPEYDLGFFYPNGSAYFEKTIFTRTSGLIENTLSYKKVINKHNINILGGISFQNFDDYQMRGRTSGLLQPYVPTLANGTSTKTITDYIDGYSIFSILGRFDYNYDDRYFITANARRDGSSKFPENNRYAVLPSVALAWKIHNDIQLPDFINELKLRGGYGKVGNLAIPNYGFQPALNSNVTYSFNNNRVFGASAIRLVDENLRWEVRTSSSVALDMQFWESLDFSAEYYSNLAEDIIVEVPVPLSVGSLPAALLTNGGSMRNSGIELTLNYRKYFGDLFIEIAPNFYTLKNEVLALGEGNNRLDDLGARTVVGGAIGRHYGWVYDGIFQSDEEVSSHAFQGNNTAPGDIRFIDINNDGEINDADRTFIGNALPDKYFGLNITAEYRNFDLTAFASGSAGAVAINNMYRALMSSQASGNTNFHEDILRRWTPENPNTDVPRMIFLDPNLNGRASDRPGWLQSTNYLRMNTLSLGYSLPVTSIERVGLSRTRFYVTAQNLFTITPYKGFNPDFQSMSILAPGYDFGTYPRPQTYMVGVQLSF